MAHCCLNGDCEAPEIDRLMEAIQKTEIHLVRRADGADARIVALDPVIDPANGNIMVPLVDGSIYLADREGNKLSLLAAEKGHGTGRRNLLSIRRRPRCER